ncbi:hypothetical protein GCM10020254_57660 [Streptomyces goshikiensis]
MAPGGRVALNITGCGTKTGRATSRAFGDVQLTPGNLEASNLFGGATVYNNTPPTARTPSRSSAAARAASRSRSP